MPGADSIDVLIRVDASLRMGTGHIFRTLVVAGWLRSAGHNVVFVSRRLPGNLIERVRDHGFRVIELGSAGTARMDTWLEVEPDAELAEMREVIGSCSPVPRWVMVDHFSLDATWEREIGALGPRLFVIDDLANRPHDADALLDNIVGSADRYDRLLPLRTRRFLGPRYAPVRDEFVAERLKSRARDGSIRRILIFYGGVDYTGETVKALRALRKLGGELHVDVAVGATNPRRAEIENQIARDSRARMCVGDAEMAAVTGAADLVLGAIGSAMWERCFVGVPSVTTTTLGFLEAMGERMERTGAAISLGPAAHVSETLIRDTVRSLQMHPDRVTALGMTAFSLCDGFEAARRDVIDVFGA